MQLSKVGRKLDDGEGQAGAKRRRPTPRVVSAALEKKEEKRESALARVMDRYGASERFEMEQSYREAMDRERATNRIVSFGRKNPVFPQGAIVRSVRQIPKAWTKRGETVPEHKRVVPLGAENCFNIVPGEVCIQLFQHRVPNPKVKQGDTTLVVTSCVNGLGPRTKGQFGGISTTANKADGEDRSNNLMAGLATVIHTGHQTIPAFATVMFSLTPYSVRGDTPGSMVPAIDEKGQPEDKFRVALHPLDERVVSAMLLRCRKKVDAILPAEGTDVGTFKAAYWDALQQLVTDELSGFELMPDDKPLAAYILWYGIQRAMIFAIGSNFNFDACGAAGAIKEAREKFKVSREDEEFVSSHAGTVDTSEERALLNILESKQDVPAFKAYFGGIDKLISVKIDHAVQGQHCALRRNIVGISQGWSNPGSELDLLVGMGGKHCVCCVGSHFAWTGY